MSFKNRKQYRLKGYDYSQNWAYFITIVTKNREHFFGYIENKKMILSPIGKFVEQNFSLIEKKITYLAVTEFSIMPDHLHLVILIDNDETFSDTAEMEYNIPEQTSRLQPLTEHSISSFANHLKGTIKKWCNKNGYPGFDWQDKFHDRVIRNEKEYRKIVAYVQNNVRNWKTL